MLEKGVSLKCGVRFPRQGLSSRRGLEMERSHLIQGMQHEGRHLGGEGFQVKLLQAVVKLKIGVFKVKNVSLFLLIDFRGGGGRERNIDFVIPHI